MMCALLQGPDIAPHDRNRGTEGDAKLDRVVVEHPCDECGGDGHTGSGECRVCFGLGMLSLRLSRSEFRELVAQLDKPEGSAS
jgi:hypothetical protein